MEELYAKLHELFPKDDDERGEIWAALLNTAPAERPLYFVGGDTTARSALRSLSRSAVRSLPCSPSVVNVLLCLFGSKLKEARSVHLVRNAVRDADTLPLRGDGNLKCDADPGIFFPILGRDDALCSLVQGAASAFLNYTRDNSLRTSNDIGQRKPHFNAVIAYPGAGKSTIGTDLPSLFRDYWSSGKAATCLTPILSKGQIDVFSEVVKNSWGYNCFFYHNIDEHNRGKLFPLEKELLAQGSDFQVILALRFLHAAMSKLVCPLLYEETLSSVKHIAKMIKFSNVLLFIRRGLEIPDGKMVMISLFLDEINGAELIGGGVSWVQKILVSYVHLLQSARVAQVLPVITVACTKHEAASLKLTSARRTPHFPVPLSVLLLDDSLSIVSTFFRKLSTTLNEQQIEMNNELQLCIELAGGMPRILGFMVRGMFTSSATEEIPAAKLLEAARNFSYDIFIATMKNTISLTSWLPSRYKDGHGFMVLVNALRHSLLSTTVFRSQKVVDEIDDLEENSWGRLEQKALVALKVLTKTPLVDPDDWPCRVVFPPLLALKLQDMRVDEFSMCFPSAIERGFCSREWNDLKFIAFMILLLKLGRLQAHTYSVTFKLRDIFPFTWDIPLKLETEVLPYPNQLKLYSTLSRVTAGFLATMQGYLGHDFGLMYCGNSGRGTVLVVGDWLIVIQSRSQPKADANIIFWSCFSDLTGLTNLLEVPTEAFGPPPSNLRQDPPKSEGVTSWTSRNLKLKFRSLEGMDVEIEDRLGNTYSLDKVVYVYSSQHISLKERNRILQSENPLCQRIVIRDNDTHGVFDVLSSVRQLVHTQGSF